MPARPAEAEPASGTESGTESGPDTRADITPIGLRARQARRVHDELLDSGLELIAAHGYDQVTVAAIAHHAGVSPRTFFRYFASKDALVAAPFVALAERLVEAMLDQPAHRDAWSAVREATLQAAIELEADPTTFRRAAAAAEGTPHPLLPSATRLAELEETARTEIERRLPDRADPQAAALLSGLQSVVLRTAITRWIAGTDERSLAETVRAGLDGVGRGALELAGSGPDDTSEATSDDPGPPQQSGH